MRVWYENTPPSRCGPAPTQRARGIIKNHIDPAIGQIPLTKLTTLDLQKFYRDLLTGGRVERKESEKKPKGLGPKTVAEYPSNHLLRFAVGNPPEAHPSQPGGRLRSAPGWERNEMKTLTADQLTTFLQEAKRTGVFEMYYLELATGPAPREPLGIKMVRRGLSGAPHRAASDFANQRAEWWRPAENQERPPGDPLGDRPWPYCKASKRNPQRVCISLSPMAGLSRRTACGICSAGAEAAGLPYVRFHDLRHPYVKPTTKKYLFFLVPRDTAFLIGILPPPVSVRRQKKA